MHELIQKLLGVAWGVWRYRWTSVIVAWLICVVGWTYVALMPNKYITYARVYVETESILRPLLKDITVQSDTISTVLIMKNLLLNQPNLQKLIVETGLSERVKSESDMRNMIASLKTSIIIEDDRSGPNLYKIAYRDSNPRMAEKIVSALVNGFVGSIRTGGEVNTSTAQRFLDEQIAEYEGRLEKAEQILKEFKLKHVGVMPDAGADFYQRLQTAIREKSGVELELREAERRLSELERQVAGEEPIFGLSNREIETNETRSLDARITRLRSDLDDLLLRYTEQHPDVVYARDTIAELESQKRALQKKLSGRVTEIMADENPVYQRLRIALGEVEAEVAGLRVRYNEHESRVNFLQERVELIPEVEADLVKLNRDYNVIKEQYETLLSRREAAKLSGDVESTADNLKFRIIDPPQIPYEPTWPNRGLFFTAILVLGLGAGVGIAFLATQYRLVFEGGKELSMVTGLPLLGVVSQHMTEAQILENHLKMKYFSITAGSLLGLYCLAMIGQAI
jgi:polysaccharide chain length determinant protein (PEP-CTERM system associated)